MQSENKNQGISRRAVLQRVAAGAAAVTAAPILAGNSEAAGKTFPKLPATGGKLKGRIHHSACKWCYGGIPFEKLCAAAS